MKPGLMMARHPLEHTPAKVIRPLDSDLLERAIAVKIERWPLSSLPIEQASRFLVLRAVLDQADCALCFARLTHIAGHAIGRAIPFVLRAVAKGIG